jgi:hypothetical protein
VRKRGENSPIRRYRTADLINLKQFDAGTQNKYTLSESEMCIQHAIIGLDYILQGSSMQNGCVVSLKFGAGSLPTL